MHPTKDYEAFDGQVVFVMRTYQAALYMALYRDLTLAIPDALEVRENGVRYLKEGGIGSRIGEFLYLYGYTDEIRFALTDDSPAELHALKEFYDGAGLRDSVSLFERFQRKVSEDVLSAWYGARAAAKDSVPSAAPEVGVGAGERAASDSNFPQAGSASSA